MGPPVHRNRRLLRAVPAALPSGASRRSCHPVWGGWHGQAARPGLRYGPALLRAAPSLRRDLGCRPGTEMIEVARAKALAAELVDIRFVTSAAEQLSAPDSSFDLVAIGNAFHRLRRDTVAARVLRWLRPDAFLALVWSDSPWVGDAPWQRALAATMRRWTDPAETRGRVPVSYDADRVARPDQAILQDSRVQLVGRYDFAVQRVWTREELAGFMASTSVLSRPALGDLAADFDADLERELSACASAGTFHQVVRFAYDLARRPV